MRSRRDPFARESFVPVRQHNTTCQWCGNAERRAYSVQRETDGGRTSSLTGTFCSWSCAESYHGEPIARFASHDIRIGR